MRFNESGRLNREDLYPCSDRPRGYLGMIPTTRIAGIWTGEKRAPKQGDWYISGAVPACYRAPNDLMEPHAIARLVVTKRAETYLVLGDFVELQMPTLGHSNLP